MKNKTKIIQPILLLSCMLFLCASCTKDTAGGNPPAKGEKEVEMTFLPPGASTRAAIPAEDKLNDITLLIFDGNQPGSTFQYSRYTWRTAPGENRFKTTLKIADGITIYFAANVKEQIQQLETDNELIEGTTTWAEAKELLMLDTPTDFDVASKGLPMWGHKFNVDITNAPNNDLGKVNLLRSVASTDITVLATNFKLEKGHLVYAANKGYLAYDPASISNNQASVPHSPADMVTSVQWSKTVLPADNNQINNYFYMYDNATSLTPTGTNRPTKVILEGKWTDASGSGASTFYPLTFRNLNSLTGKYDKKQVTRNNKYLIVITGVYGDGWSDIDDAKDADDVNMEYDVIDWNENEDGEIIVDGTKYFYRSASEVHLGFEQNSTAQMVYRTNYSASDIKMTFTSGGTGVAGPVSNDRFKAENMTIDPDGIASSGDEYTCFRFTALKPYAADSDNPSVLYVTAGRIAFSITVKQLDREPGKWDDGGNDNADL